ncbi:MAG TPA: N-acetylmuramoyl-L-alanine amidase [Alphaproteobacteria bacterium]|nr:N-acetylmuramoyl-L-alanine amidase [Alphaproteobacteria bacterium]
MKNINKNRKAQIFIISVIIAVTIALGTSFILLNYMFKETAENQAIGTYQAAIMDSIATGDSVSTYVDSAYSLAVSNALDEYFYGNPKPVIASKNNDGAIDAGEVNYCGNYIYRVWNSENKNCYPDFRSKEFELNAIIDKNFGELTYLSKSLASEEYFDNILLQPIYYDYKYDISKGSTKIIAYPKESYKIHTLNSNDVKSNEDVKAYLDGKYLGAEGDIEGIPLIPPASGNFRTANNRKIEYIVIHYTAGHDIAGAMSRFSIPNEGASSHYIVGAEKDEFKTIQAVLDSDVSYHGGCDSDKYGCAKEEYKSINSKSIGIEVVNYAYDRIEKKKDNGQTYEVAINTNKESCETGRPDKIFYPSYNIGGKDTGANNLCWTKFPEEQYKNLVALTAILAKKYDIPIDRTHIIGHVEIVLKNKVDPGPAFDMDKFVLDVQEAAKNDISINIAELSGASSQECIVSDDTDWEITGAKISNSIYTSDQIMKATVNVKNDADNCVILKSKLTAKYTIDGKEYVDMFEKTINAYKNSEKNPTTDIEFSCSFTTDPKIYQSKRTTDCLFLVPESSEIKYTISFSATDQNSDSDEFIDDALVFTAKKYIGKQVDLIVAGDLTESERNKISAAKLNLEKLGVLEYINEIAEENNIPRELILGLITQESGGNLDADSGLAAGLMQVTKSTFDGIKFEDKCTWEEYKKDAKCQIRAGVAVLKANYESVSDKTIYYVCNKNCYGENNNGAKGYWSSCKGGCDQSKCIGPINKQYSGWEAALRRYNGGGSNDLPKSGEQTSGCVNQPDYEYVEKVMRLANGWGYAGTNDVKIKEELNHGILGVYSIRPTLSKDVGFDFKIIDMLVVFAKETSKTCGAEGVNKNDCIKSQIEEWNLNLPQEYKYIKLSDQCDENTDIAKINKFAEELNECMQSLDDNCKCKFSNNVVKIKSISSDDDSSALSYYDSNDDVKNIYFDHGIYDANGEDLVKNSLSASDILFYKKAGQMTQGASSFTKECSAVKKTYRMCLDTNQKYTAYDETNEKVVEKYIVIPFAITIRDNVAPKRIQSVSYGNMQHDENSIVLKWTPGKERDITHYNIYMSSDKTKLEEAQTQYLKEDVKFKSLYIVDEKYESYKSIDINNPICKLSDSSNDVKYCSFEYNAVDASGNSVKIGLEKEKLYYLSDEDKFMYILDGKLSYNELQADSEKFIAVTANDIDGNEIDNLADDQKIKIDENMISVIPKNMLSPALALISGMPEISQANNENIIKLSWGSVGINIDGSSYYGSIPIKYTVYTSSIECADSEVKKITDFNGNYGPYDRNSDVGINLGSQDIKCIGVSASAEDKKFDSVITKSLNLPSGAPS